MKKIYALLILLTIVFSCNSQEPTQFSEEALSDIFINLEGNSTTFNDILNIHTETSLVIDIWASWCSDCIKGMPKVKALQKAYPDAAYIFLSLDKNQEAWKRGIEKYNVEGEHYFMKSGWDGPFGEFVNLDWIPRYMVVDTKGNIKLFKAIKADDKKLKQYL